MKWSLSDKGSWRRRLAALLIAVLVAGLLPLPQGGSEAEEGPMVAEAADGSTEGSDYFFSDATGTQKVHIDATGGVYEMRDNVVTLSVWDAKRPGAIVSGATIQLDPGTITNDVVDIIPMTAANGNVYSLQLKIKGPGYTTVSGLVTDPGNVVYRFSFLIKVPLAIERNTNRNIPNLVKYFALHNNDEAPSFSLEMRYPTVRHQIQLKYFKAVTGASVDMPFDYTNTDLSWSVTVDGDADNDKVVRIDRDGILTAVGAGLAKLTVSTKETDPLLIQKANINIEVPLLFSATQPAITQTSPSAIYKKFGQGGTQNPISIKTDISGRAVFYTTAYDPVSDMEWEILDENNKDASDFFEISAESMEETGMRASRVNLVGSKAGKYTVIGRIKDTDKKLPYWKATLNVEIPVDYSPKHIWMNVEDTYDLYENTNIPDPASFTYKSDDPKIAQVDGKGVITAKKKGETMVYAYPSNMSFDDAKDNGVLIICDVHVVDTLSLSTGDATIPIGGTLNLIAHTTNPEYPITWKVKDDTVVSLESDGNVGAVITGLKSGETTVSATQKIGGVEKTVTCNVTVVGGITKIEVKPSELELDIGEPGVLQATVSPPLATKVELHWISSDPSVVAVKNPNDFSDSCSITAVAPGTAVVMAINKVGQSSVVVGSCKVTVLCAPEKITISETQAAAPMSRKNYQLFASVTPTDATNQKINWTSSNPKIATVDDNGLVTFVKHGTVTIIAASDAKPELMAMCELTITEPVSSVTLDTTNITLTVGETYRLTYTVSPETAYDRSVNFTSMDSKVATVTSNGLISARKAGTTYVTITTTDGKLSQVCTVTVKQSATALKLDATGLVLDAGETYTLEATFTPKTTTEVSLRWASNDPSVAKVDSKGKVTAVGEGTCIVSVTTANNLSVFCFVTVNQPVTGIKLEKEEVKVDKGKFVELTATVLPENATNPKVKWTTSNKKVAEVSDTGTVKGIGGGSAIITCTTEEGGYFAVCMVTVIEKIVSMDLNKSTYKLGLGKKYTLTAKVKNSAATDQTVTWVSSNPKIVSVNQKGIITGKKLGYATITAYAKDGSEAEASCEVRVVRQATGITINTSILNMVVGDSSTLKATIKPNNATYKKAKFTSSDTNIAIVDANGKVTAVGAGNCKITAAPKDSSGLKAVCVVYVREAVPATGLTLNPSEVTLGIGGTETVSAALKPTNSTDHINWSSNNKAVATVGKSSGIIKGIAPGTAVVTATTSSGKSAPVKVTVVGLNYSSLTLEQYDSYVLRVMGVTSGIIWDVDNPDICTVVGGRVTAKKAGTTTVVARVNGAELRCQIRVTEIGE